MHSLVVVVLALMVLLEVVSLTNGETSGCEHGEIVRYNVTFVAEWSPRKFPKMFPRYRPPAQWSKLIGRTHSPKYTMWKMGSPASPALKMFAEEGSAATYDRESQGHKGIFDAFTAAPLYTGVGRASTKVFVDGIHSKVSLLVKMIPSPDWFVGVDGIDLCQDGQWRNQLKMRLDPIDAGTDKGLTFTAPNWPSLPQEEVHTITSQRPNHVASAFYYPKLKKLRRIGYLIFEKLLSYEREDKTEVRRPLFGINPVLTSSQPKPESSQTSQQFKPQKEPEERFRLPAKVLPPSDGIVLSDAPSQTSEESEHESSKVHQKTPVEPHLETSRDLEEEESLEGVATPLNCLVSKWSAWSPCSKTCGFGQKERTRLVIQKSQNGGVACPTLVQTSLCGSMKNCRWKHFRFQKWRTG